MGERRTDEAAGADHLLSVPPPPCAAFEPLQIVEAGGDPGLMRRYHRTPNLGGGDGGEQRHRLGGGERQIKAGVPRPKTATKPRPITRVVAREKRLKVTPIRRASQPESRRLAADPSAGRLAVLAVVIVPGELRALVVPGVPRCGDREH